MHSLEKYLRRCSKRLGQKVQSVQVLDGGRLVAVIMNQHRFLSARYSQKTKARKRVYSKTHIALSVFSIQVELPDAISRDGWQEVLGGSSGFDPIFFKKSKYGRVAVCISPQSFRLLRKTAFIKRSHKSVEGYINSLPVYRSNGKLIVSGEVK